MSNGLFSIFLLLCIISLVLGSDESDRIAKTEQKKDVKEDSNFYQGDLEIQRRKEIVKNYLDTLAKEKETSDDIISNPTDERQSISHTKKEEKFSSQLKKDVKEHSNSYKDDLEIQRRKEIAKNHLDTLARAKETWVDPFDMIAYPVDERQSISYSKEEEDKLSSEFHEPNFDNDYRPLFSDIRGEVIGPNSAPKENSDDEKNTGKLFSNGRHQICVLESIFVSRWLKMLINKIERDSDPDPSAMTIPLSQESLNELKQLSNAKAVEITVLDEFVSNLITKAIIIQRESYDWASLASNFVSLVQGLCILILTCFMIYILYRCLIYRPFFTIIWISFISSVLFNWIKLYQKSIAQKHYQLSRQTSSDCQMSDFNLWDHFQYYIKSYIATDQCEKHYEALFINPIWEVSLVVALSETITSMLVQPLYSGSKAINATVKLLFDGLSFLNILILLFFIFLVLIMLFNYRIRFPFFMGSLEPSYNHRHYVEDINSESTLNKLVNSVCRIMPLQEMSVNEATAERKSLLSGSFRNKQNLAIDSKAKYRCVNKDQLVGTKQHSCMSKVSSTSSTPTEISKDLAEPKQLALCTKQVDDGTESAGDGVDDFDLIEKVDVEKENHSSSSHDAESCCECSKYFASSMELNYGEDDDNSIENICVACDRDTSNTLSMSVSNKNTCENFDSIKSEQN